MRKKSFIKEDHEEEVASFQEKGFVVAYTDGSCWWKDKKGGVGVFLEDEFLKKSFSSGPFINTTISRMELCAIIEALKMTDREKCLIIYSDSEYAVEAINVWSENWDLEERLNGDLLIEILDTMNEFKKRPIIKHIPGHQGVEGNLIADKLASQGRKNK